jgi:hypothetical protein
VYFQDLDSAEAFVDDWAARAGERARQAQEMATQLHDLTAKATSHDGNVTVIVNNVGIPTDIRLENEVERWPAPRTAEAIMATMRAAQIALRGRVTAVAERTVGVDTEAGRHVLASFDRLPSAEAPANGESGQ